VVKAPHASWSAKFLNSNLFLGLTTLAAAVVTSLVYLYVEGKPPFRSHPANAELNPAAVYAELLKKKQEQEGSEQGGDAWHITALVNQGAQGISYMVLGPRDRIWSVSTIRPGERHTLSDKGDYLFQFMDNTGKTYWLKSTKFTGGAPSKEQTEHVEPNVAVLEEKLNNTAFWHLYYRGQENLPMFSWTSKLQ
jgi:hypothetical protein